MCFPIRQRSVQKCTMVCGYRGEFTVGKHSQNDSGFVEVSGIASQG